MQTISNLPPCVNTILESYFHEQHLPRRQYASISNRQKII